MPAEDGKKPVLAIALGLKKGGGSKGPPPSEPGEMMEDEDEAPNGKEVAAGEIMDAIKAGDRGALMEALESFVGMCGDY